MYTQQIIAPTYLYIPKREYITEMFECELNNYGEGKLYLTQNFIIFNSTINYSKKLPLLMSDIDSIKFQKDKIILTTDVKCYESNIFIFSFKDPNIKEIYQTIKNRLTSKNKIESNMQNKIKNFLYHKNFSTNEIENSKKEEEKNNENYSNEVSFTEEFPTRLNIFLYRKKDKKQNNNFDIDLKYFPIPFLNLSEIKDKFESKKMIVLNYSAEKLFKTFIFGTGDSTKDKLTQVFYYQTLEDHFDISEENWIFDEEKKEYLKNVYFKLKLSAIPFINESSVCSILHYKPEKNKFIFKSISTSKGVPMCDSFKVVDIKEIYPINENSCVMKFTGYNEFIQNCFLKNIINQTSYKTFQENEKTWCNFLKNNGVVIENYDEDKIDKLIKEKQLKNEDFEEENRNSCNTKDNSSDNSDNEKNEEKKENLFDKFKNFWNVQLKEAQKKVKEKLEKEKLEKEKIKNENH